MEINLECSDIINDDYSQFFDNNSQICLNEESFVVGGQIGTPQNQFGLNTSIQHQLLQTVSKQQESNRVQDYNSKSSSQSINQNQGKVATVYEQKREEAKASASTKIFDDEQPVTIEEIAVKIELGIEKTEVQVTPPLPVIEAKEQPKPAQAATSWQKVTFQKKRPSSNVTPIQGDKSQLKRLPSQKSAQFDSNQTSSIRQNSLQAQKNRNEEIKKKLSANRDPSEPLPVFDCLFCCQEHFVLKKINDQINVNKYSKSIKYFQDPKDTLLFKMQITDYLQVPETPLNYFEELEQVMRVPVMSDYFDQIEHHSKNEAKTKPTVMSETLERMRKMKLEKKNLGHNQPELQKQKAEVKKIGVDNFFGLSCANMSAIDESNFANIHLRTRRQQVLFKISFESDCHNIYEPMFTSDEEDDSVNLEDSESEEYGTESYGNEEEEEEDEEQLEYKTNELSEISKPLEFNRNAGVSPVLHHEKMVNYLTETNQEANRCSISSIEQSSIEKQPDEEEEEEEGFTRMVDEPDLKAGQQQIKSQRKMDNLMNQDEDELSVDEDSERYTFGCITPKGEEALEILDQQKLTFANKNGETSLSPVRSYPLLKKGERAGHNEYMDNFSPSIQKNPMLLEISPLSYGQLSNGQVAENVIHRQKVIANQGSGLQQNFQKMYNDGRENSARKIDFYPSHEIDSIDIQITNQQKSYDASDILGSMPNMLQNLSKPTEESKLIMSLEDQPQKGVTSHSSQSSIEDSDVLDEQEEEDDDYSQQVRTQCFTNNFIHTDQEHQGQPQSQSFTMNGLKHQRLIPQNKAVLERLSQDISPLMLLKKDEKFKEMIRKANQFKSTSNHMTSFDSIIQAREKLHSNMNIHEQIITKKAQTICTPIDTAAENGVQYTVITAKNNQTTVMQNTRRQNTASNLGASSKTCKNKSSASNILLGVEAQNFSNRGTVKGQIDFNSTKNIGAKAQKNYQRLLENHWLHDSQPVRNAQTTTSKQATKNNHMYTNSVTSPSIFGKQSQQNQIQQAFQSLQPSAWQNLNLNQLNKKGFHENLRSALMSTRFSTNSANIQGLFKIQQQSIDFNANEVSKSNVKKKKKTSKVGIVASRTQGGSQLGESKKIKASKNKVKKGKINQQMQDYYYQRNDEVLTQLNDCNFSNDNSIRYMPGTRVNTQNAQSHSQINKNNNNTSSQNTLMYLSMQDNNSRILAGHSGFHNPVGCNSNSTHLQDTSNNFHYGNSQQAEMSTCISAADQLKKGQKSQLSSRRKNLSKQNQENGLNVNGQKQLNGSIDDMSLFKLLGSLQTQQQKMQMQQIQSSDNIEKKKKNGKQSHRGSLSIQRNQISSSVQQHATSVERQISTQPSHQGQFSFSQNQFKLNLTTNITKSKLDSKEKKRKSKGGSTLINNFGVNTISSNTTLKNTQVQSQRRDGGKNPRTRSSSKSNQNIKSDVPTHQLLLNNLQQPKTQQLVIKNKNILLTNPNGLSAAFPNALLQKQVQQAYSNNQSVIQQLACKSQASSNIATAQKSKKGQMICHTEHNSNILAVESQHHSQTRQKASSKQSNKNPSLVVSNLGELSKLYGTGLPLTQLTSPLRIQNNSIFGATAKQGLGANQSIAIKGELLFQSQLKEFKKQQ